MLALFVAMITTLTCDCNISWCLALWVQLGVYAAHVTQSESSHKMGGHGKKVDGLYFLLTFFDFDFSIKTHGAGKVPIGHKPELTKKFQERKRHEMQKEMDKEKEQRRTSMEVKLMERLKMVRLGYVTDSD